MAQIEVIMYIALGFATAALIALLLARLLWELAVGVGRRRAQRTAPPAVAELQAERNQLRAEYAMLARRVEVRLDEVKMQLAEHMAEVSRSRNRIDILRTEIDRRDATLAERDAEIARLQEQIEALQAELTARTESLHKLENAHGALGRDHEAARLQVTERERHIERLSAQVDQLATARSEAQSRERSVQERLKARIEDLSALSQQIEAQRRQLLVQQSHSQTLRDLMAGQQGPEPAGPAGETVPGGPIEAAEAPLERRIEEAERQAGALQDELDRLDEMWAAKLADVARSVAGEAADDRPGPAGVEDAVVNGSGRPSEAGVMAEGGAGKPEAGGKKTAGGLANVISLAQRIRALQRNGS